MNDRIGIEKQSQPGPVARKEATGVFEQIEAFEQIEGNIIANMARNSARTQVRAREHTLKGLLRMGRRQLRRYFKK
ncbi:hypothetical protein [Sodaliphilus pleomorphus]|uniref:Uncharacterized protein n=1 Tax=Sodaliphilus pleomorphus TaxID=2606626 RepID=A0A6L5X9L8_9BACT|nr:hypothetical protein [Sodaliphilus pleomorphus]MSS16941.1 hypothetical protein [Sodaliphilus pleomorphus]